MTSVLLVISGASVWTLEDGTRHPTGYWASEVTHPAEVFARAGYDITFATPGGVTPTLDAISLDPAMNGGDIAAVEAQRTALAQLAPALAAPAFLEDVDPAAFDIVFVAGGHGPMEDLADNADIGRILVAAAADPSSVIGAVCHGVAALLSATDAGGAWAFKGAKLTGFSNAEEVAFGYADRAPWLLETRLRDAGAHFHNGPTFASYVVSDGSLVTGQNPASAGAAAEAVIRAFEERA